jgi:hypothetical protein
VSRITRHVGDGTAERSPFKMWRTGQMKFYTFDATTYPGIPDYEEGLVIWICN